MAFFDSGRVAVGHAGGGAGQLHGEKVLLDKDWQFVLGDLYRTSCGPALTHLVV